MDAQYPDPFILKEKLVVGRRSIIASNVSGQYSALSSLRRTQQMRMGTASLNTRFSSLMWSHI